MIVSLIGILVLLSVAGWIYRHPPEKHTSCEGTIYALESTALETIGTLIGLGAVPILLMLFPGKPVFVVVAGALAAAYWIWDKRTGLVRMDYDEEYLTVTSGSGRKTVIPGAEVCHLSFGYTVYDNFVNSGRTVYSNAFPTEREVGAVELFLHTTKGERLSFSASYEDAKMFADFWFSRPGNWGSAPVHLKGIQRIVGPRPYLAFAAAAVGIFFVSAAVWCVSEDWHEPYRWDAQNLESVRITFSALKKERHRGTADYYLTDENGQQYAIEGRKVSYFALEEFQTDIAKGDPLWIVYAQRSRTYGWREMLFGLLDEEDHLRFIPHTDSSIELYGISGERKNYLCKDDVLEEYMNPDSEDRILIGIVHACGLLCLLGIPYFRYAARNPERHRIFLHFHFKQGRVLSEKGVPMNRSQGNGITYYRV